jgi:hypothetical protein
MPEGVQEGRARARRCRQEESIMVRSSVRRAAVLAGSGALVVLAAAGPAMAADVAPPARTVAAVSASAPEPAPVTQSQLSGTEQADGSTVIWCHHHHHGLLSGLLEGVGDLLGALL